MEREYTSEKIFFFFNNLDFSAKMSSRGLKKTRIFVFSRVG